MTPGGMEIDNQDREIYHIVDNTPKPSGEVNIRPAPDMPKLVVENTLPPSEAMDSLVESIDGDDSLNKVETELIMQVREISIGDGRIVCNKDQQPGKSSYTGKN